MTRDELQAKIQAAREVVYDAEHSLRLAEYELRELERSDGADVARAILAADPTMSARVLGEHVADAARDHGLEAARMRRVPTTVWARFRVLLGALVQRLEAQEVTEPKPKKTDPLDHWAEELMRRPEFVEAQIDAGKLGDAALTFVLEAIGRHGSPQGRRIIQQHLSHASPIVREGALYGASYWLGGDRDAEMLATVRRMAESDASPGVCRTAREVLADLEEP